MTLKIDLENDVQLAWPTPIFNRLWPDTADLNERLCQEILVREEQGERVTRSVKNGWHSTEDLLDWPIPETQPLVSMIKEAVAELSRVSSGTLPDEFVATAWANVLRSGGYNKVHTHPGCSWSGVYYVRADDVGDESRPDGWIEFHDPRTGVEMVRIAGEPFGAGISYQPEAGRMFVFPSWLRHLVYPYTGTGIRISIAFNVNVR